MIRVFVVAPTPMMIAGLRAMLTTTEIEVVGAAASFAESGAISEFIWYSMLISAFGLCFGPGGIPWSYIIMSC